MNQMNGMGLNAIQRPTPFYPGASVSMTATQVNGGGVTNETSTAADEGRMSVSIDFGTTFSGVVSRTPWVKSIFTVLIF